MGNVPGRGYGNRGGYGNPRSGFGGYGYARGGNGNSHHGLPMSPSFPQSLPKSCLLNPSTAPLPPPSASSVILSLTEDEKQAVCEKSYLGNKGYSIPKTCLSKTEIDYLKKETSLTPKVMGPSFGAPGTQKPPPDYPYYRENSTHLYLPRAFGISRYGLPYETRISPGRDASKALAFASDKPLRDYQNEIIGVFLEHVRKQVLEFETVVESDAGDVESMSMKSPTALIPPEKNSGNQTHLDPVPVLERVDYGGGGILEVPCGRGKCLAKNTPILMYDGSIKKVQDVEVGDWLMGDDSTPRLVLSLARGREKMYQIKSRHSEDDVSYTVNESHILSLKNAEGEVIDIPLLEYLKYLDILEPELSSSLPYYYGYRVPIVFEHHQVYRNPYKVGLQHVWKDLQLSSEFRRNSSHILKEVLAGMIDSHGIYTGFVLSSVNGKIVVEKEGGYEIMLSKSNKHLSDSIVFIARSLGFKAVKKYSQYSCVERPSFCCSVFIQGERIHTIPVRIDAMRDACIRDSSLRPEILKRGCGLLYELVITEKGEADYYGFEIDGNRRFVLGDFSVTHNTVMALKIISEIGRPALIFVNKGFLADQWLERIATYLPHASVGRIQADIFDIEGRDIVICMIQTIYDRDYTSQGVFRDFGITVIDEVHRIGSGEYSKAMFNITTPYVLGISATVDRKDGMEQALKLFIGDVLYSDKRQDGDAVQIRCVEYADATNEEYNVVEYDFRGNVKYATMMSKICEYRPRLDFLFRILVDLVEEYPEDISEMGGCGIPPLKPATAGPGTGPGTLENYFAKTGEEKGAVDCLVCHRSVCASDFIQTSCGHSFCETCLDDLETPKCPLCKKRFTLLMNSMETSTAPSASGSCVTGTGTTTRLTEYPGQNQIIVLAQYRSVLRELYKRIQSTGLTTVGYYVGGMKQEDLDISKTKQILLATYSMASEGLDVATLSTLVFATPRTDIKQSVGRILRQKHERNPIVVDVVDSHGTFKNQWSKRRAYYKQNGYAIYRISCDQYAGGGMKDIEKTWKLLFDPSSVAKGPKVVGKKGEILGSGGGGGGRGLFVEKGVSEEVDSDGDDSEAIRKMAFDGVCML